MVKKSSVVNDDTATETVETVDSVDPVEPVKPVDPVNPDDELDIDFEAEEEKKVGFGTSHVATKPVVKTRPSNQRGDNIAHDNRIYLENKKGRRDVGGFIFDHGTTELSVMEFTILLNNIKEEIHTFEKSTGLELLDLEEGEEYTLPKSGNAPIRHTQKYLETLNKKALKVAAKIVGAKVKGSEKEMIETILNHQNEK